MHEIPCLCTEKKVHFRPLARNYNYTVVLSPPLSGLLGCTSYLSLNNILLRSRVQDEKRSFAF